MVMGREEGDRAKEVVAFQNTPRSSCAPQPITPPERQEKPPELLVPFMHT